MTKNFPILVKEKDTQVQKSMESPKQDGPKRTTPRHIIIKMEKHKDKERVLNAAREKQVPTRELQLDCHLIFQQKYFRLEGITMKYSR